MLKSVLTYGLLLSFVVPSNAADFSELAGTWSQHPKLCRDAMNDETRMIVSYNKLQGYDSTCIFPAIPKERAGPWTIQMSCTSDDEQKFQRILKLDLRNGKFFIADVGRGFPEVTLYSCAASSLVDQSMPTRIGSCSESYITRISGRFGGVMKKPRPGTEDLDGGVGIELKNGVYGVGPEYVDAVAKSRVGDRVRTCLVSVPKNCPKGDDRGKEYKTTNMRTKKSWTLPDAQHMCGGA